MKNDRRKILEFLIFQVGGNNTRAGNTAPRNTLGTRDVPVTSVRVV